jgi:hypothetical protein
MAGLKVGVQKNRPLSQIITLTITGRGKQYNEPNDSNLHNRKTLQIDLYWPKVPTSIAVESEVRSSTLSLGSLFRIQNWHVISGKECET